MSLGFTQQGMSPLSDRVGNDETPTTMRYQGHHMQNDKEQVFWQAEDNSWTSKLAWRYTRMSRDP